MDKEDTICVYTHTMEYYSAIKRMTMPLAATWMDLEIIILSEISQRQIYISYMWDLKNNTDNLIYKAEIDSQAQKKKLKTAKEGSRQWVERQIKSLILTYTHYYI